MKRDTVRKEKPGKPACARAGVLMMKYMDGEMTDAEAENLRRHIEHCESCREDFMAYDMILGELSEEEADGFAPDGFTEAVMARIEKLGEKPAALPAVDNILYVVFGVFSGLFGLGFLIAINRERIMAYLSEYPVFNEYLTVITPLAEKIMLFFQEFLDSANTVMQSAGEFLSQYRFIVVVVFAAVLFSQYFVARRGRSGAAAGITKK